MKRGGALKRKTPLQARKSLSRGNGPRGGAIKPSAPIFGGNGPEFISAKPKKRKPEKDKAFPWEIAHMRAVKGQPCRACHRHGPSDAHHCYHDRATKFGGKKAPHRWTVPLCKLCHQDGPQAIHRIKRTWRDMHGADHEHVVAVMLAIYGMENPSDNEIKEFWTKRGKI